MRRQVNQRPMICVPLFAVDDWLCCERRGSSFNRTCCYVMSQFRLLGTNKLSQFGSCLAFVRIQRTILKHLQTTNKLSVQINLTIHRCWDISSVSSTCPHIKSKYQIIQSILSRVSVRHHKRIMERFIYFTEYQNGLKVWHSYFNNSLSCIS